MLDQNFTNTLKQVAIYGDGALGVLANSCPLLAIADRNVDKLLNMETNLGTTTTYKKPPRMQGTYSLIPTAEGTYQRFQTHSITFQFSVMMAFTMLEREFNVEKAGQQFMKDFGVSSVDQMATAAETDLGLEIINKGEVRDNQGVLTGYNYLSGPVRFFGDGITQFDSVGKIGALVAGMQDFGIPTGSLDCILPITTYTSIINASLGQFVPDRNEKNAKSWELGNYAGINFYKSNLLPRHIAGSVGNEHLQLTVVSVNDNTGANVTEIVFDGAPASDSHAIEYGDSFQFIDGVTGFSNMRFGTWVGPLQSISTQPVQFRSIAQAGSDGSGRVTVNIYPTLTTDVPIDDRWRINQKIQAGMKVFVLPTHRAGALIAGRALKLSNPDLPPENPFSSIVRRDPTTKTSILVTSGAKVFQNSQGTAFYMVDGHSWAPEYGEKIIIPD